MSFMKVGTSGAQHRRWQGPVNKHRDREKGKGSMGTKSMNYRNRLYLVATIILGHKRKGKSFQDAPAHKRLSLLLANPGGGSNPKTEALTPERPSPKGSVVPFADMAPVWVSFTGAHGFLRSQQTWVPLLPLGWQNMRILLTCHRSQRRSLP